MSKQETLGGTDGFRGVATMEQGDGMMNPSTVAGLTASLIRHQQENGETGPVVFARDTRPSSPALHAAAIGAAYELGADIIDLGVAPTPTAQWVAGQERALATVVITASHNPAADNGIKGMPGNSKPASDVVRAISNGYWQDVEVNKVYGTQSYVVPETRYDLLQQYEDAVVTSIERHYDTSALKNSLFVIDGANGAASSLTPAIFRRLGADVIEFSCDGTGVINDGCGAADLSGLRSFLLARPDILNHPRFMGALANDGDADRVMGVAMQDGELVDITGNHLLYAFAQGQEGIVGTEYTNSGLVRKLAAQAIGFKECANGDVFVTEALQNLQQGGKNWTRGGEFTGHLVATDWLPSGDGVRSAAWFAAFAAERGITFGDIHRELPLWHEVMQKVRLDPGDKASLLESHAYQDAIMGTAELLGDDGRLIVRPSGTEPVLRLWGEGNNKDQVNRLIKNLTTYVIELQEK